MPNTPPESLNGLNNPERPRGQDLSGPEFLHYQSEWMKLAQQLFKLGRDRTETHKVDIQKALDQPSEAAKNYHGEMRLEQLKNQFESTEHHNEVVSSQKLYIDSEDCIIELQFWNEEHPFGMSEGTERDIFYIAFNYKNLVPEDQQAENINYATITNIKETITIRMLDGERQTTPQRASEISQVLKDLVSDPQIDQRIMEPEEAKLEISKIDQLN